MDRSISRSGRSYPPGYTFPEAYSDSSTAALMASRKASLRLLQNREPRRRTEGLPRSRSNRASEPVPRRPQPDQRGSTSTGNESLSLAEAATEAELFGPPQRM